MQAIIESRYPEDSYDYSTLKELILDGTKFKHFTREDVQTLAAFKALRYLSCSRTGLSTLIGFPTLPTLTKLELQDNSLNTESSGLDVLGTALPNLEILRLGGNKMKSLDKLIQYLKPLEKLQVLDVQMNPLSEKEKSDYSARLFGSLPSLRVVDGRDKSGSEVQEEEEEEDDEDDEDEEEVEGDEDEEIESSSRGGGSLLQAFYEKDYGSDDDDDSDDFDPMNAQDDSASSDSEEEEDRENDNEDADDEAEEVNGDVAKEDKKRGASEECPSGTKKARN